MTNLFNNVVTPGLVEPIEDRNTIDIIKSGESQLREVMKASYEPNKLGAQTEFNAVCLLQLASELVGGKMLVRVKARIPEIHSILPIPALNDYNTIALYPTFQASSADFGPIAGDVSAPGAIIPGTKVVVSFDQMGNFAGGTLRKVFSWKDTPPGDTTPPPGGNPNPPPSPYGQQQPTSPSPQNPKPSGTTATRPPQPGTEVLAPATGKRSGSRNTQLLGKKYKFNQKLTSNNQITDTLIDAWYELMLLTADSTGKGPIGGKVERKSLTEKDAAQRNLKGVNSTFYRDPYVKRDGKLVRWKYPKFPKGWAGRCWQFAGLLLTVLNNRLGQPYGLFPRYDYGPLPKSHSTWRAPKGGYRSSFLYPGTNISAVRVPYCSSLEKVTTISGVPLGKGCNLKDLAKLGILPGMAVMISLDWDNPSLDKPGKWGSYSACKHSCQHWLIYVGYIGGKHYYADSRGIKTAAAADNWVTNRWAAGQYGAQPCVKKWVKNFYPKVNSWAALKKIDPYSAQNLVREVYTPYPLERDPSQKPINVSESVTPVPAETET